MIEEGLTGRKDIINFEPSFSIIVPFVDQTTLDPLFEVTDSNSELIIIDPNYSKSIRNDLEDRTGYERILYMPPHYSSHLINSGISSCINSGIALSSKEFIIILRNPMEFRSDFFIILREDIKCLTDAFQSLKYVIISQTLSEFNQEERWKDTLTGTLQRFRGLNDIEFVGLELNSNDINLIVLYREIVKTVNGLDERYDNGVGFEFLNFLARLAKDGSTIMRDKYLMTYLDGMCDTKKTESIGLYYTTMASNTALWRNDKYEILNGKVRAYNNFNLDLIMLNF